MTMLCVCVLACLTDYAVCLFVDMPDRLCCVFVCCSPSRGVCRCGVAPPPVPWSSAPSLLASPGPAPLSGQSQRPQPLRLLAMLACWEEGERWGGGVKRPSECRKGGMMGVKERVHAVL